MTLLFWFWSMILESHGLKIPGWWRCLWLHPSAGESPSLLNLLLPSSSCAAVSPARHCRLRSALWWTPTESLTVRWTSSPLWSMLFHYYYHFKIIYRYFWGGFLVVYQVPTLEIEWHIYYYYFVLQQWQKNKK